jgi:hypothetical protein
MNRNRAMRGVSQCRSVEKQPQDKAVSRLTFRLHLTKSQKWKREVLGYNGYSGGRAAFASV